MSITFEELVKKFGIEPNVTPYGACVIVPGTEFDPDWEDQLSREGCRFHFVDIAGKPVTLVQKGEERDEVEEVEEREEGDGEEPVIKSPRKPPVEETAKHDIPWSENDEKLLISLWNAGLKVPAMRAKFPGRSENFLRARIRVLQRSGKIGSRWKKHKIRQPSSASSKSHSIRFWSDKDKDLLVKLWNEDLAVSKIAENFPKRTEHAVKMCVGRLRDAGRIQPRKSGRTKKPAEEPNIPKREKVEEKEQAKTAHEIPTSTPTEIPTHAPIESPVKEDPVLSLLKEIRDLFEKQSEPKLILFETYCRKCRNAISVDASEVWRLCPVCGEELIIWNVEVDISPSKRVALCPECFEPLQTRKFVDSWSETKVPDDVNEDLYCSKCNARIILEDVDPEYFLENWKSKHLEARE